MFPSEMVILMAFAASGSFGTELITRPIDVTSQYIVSLYNSLVWRGYLKRDSSEGYQLTSKGKETLIEFLRQNKNRKKDLVATLQKLGIEVSSEIDKIEKGAIGVK